MFAKNKSNETKAPKLSKAIDFESSLSVEIAKSRKIAWIIAIFSFIGMLLSIAAVLGLTPLKERVPYAIVVDKNTGYTNVLTTLDKNNVVLTANEALAKFWVQNFIINYESYNYSLLPTYYENISVWADDDVKRMYQKKYDSNNSNAIYKVLGTSKNINVIVNSMTPYPTPAGHADQKGNVTYDAKTMSAQIEKQITSSDGRVIRTIRGVVTLTYTYEPKLVMNEKARNVNPLGFQVLSYRFDPEQTIGN